MVSKLRMLMVAVGALLLWVVLADGCPTTQQAVRHVYYLEAPVITAPIIAEWHILERGEYKTACWGVCPDYKSKWLEYLYAPFAGMR